MDWCRVSSAIVNSVYVVKRVEGIDMVDLQELISRARFIFQNAPRRLQVFKLTNGKRSTKDVARKTGRSMSSVLQDIEKLRDMELIEEKKDKRGNAIKKDRAAVYQKTALIKHVALGYFRDVSQTGRTVTRVSPKRIIGRKLTTIHVPSENEILDICKYGEDQLREFKAPGTATSKITKEIAAFLHTRNGGVILYGIDDDGAVIGSDLRRQRFDQKIQNSIRNTISPQPTIEIKERNVMGSKVIIIVVPPWDRKTIYQYTMDKRYYIRRGTNVFALQPDEIVKLSRRQYVV